MLDRFSRSLYNLNRFVLWVVIWILERFFFFLGTFYLYFLAAKENLFLFHCVIFEKNLQNLRLMTSKMLKEDYKTVWNYHCTLMTWESIKYNFCRYKIQLKLSKRSNKYLKKGDSQNWFLTILSICHHNNWIYPKIRWMETGQTFHLKG